MPEVTIIASNIVTQLLVYLYEEKYLVPNGPLVFLYEVYSVLLLSEVIYTTRYLY